MCVSAQGEGGGKVLGRRGLGRFALTGAVALGAGLVSGSSAVSTRSDGGVRRRPVTPEGAWAELAAGNGRWRTLRERHPDESAGLRRELVGGQHPFAVVLGCVDSRVPPELVFDQGLGDLLTVRSAGEVLDEAVVGSVAYGVLELGIPLVVVLGHQACGAVAAAVHAETGHGELPGPLRYLAGQIRPSIDRTLRGTRAWTRRSPRTCAGWPRGWPPSPRWRGVSRRGSWRWSGPATNWPASGCTRSADRERAVKETGGRGRPR